VLKWCEVWSLEGGGVTWSKYRCGEMKGARSRCWRGRKCGPGKGCARIKS
jgi:hypothetical protein